MLPLILLLLLLLRREPYSTRDDIATAAAAAAEERAAMETECQEYRNKESRCVQLKISKSLKYNNEILHAELQTCLMVRRASQLCKLGYFDDRYSHYGVWPNVYQQTPVQCNRFIVCCERINQSIDHQEAHQCNCVSSQCMHCKMRNIAVY